MTSSSGSAHDAPIVTVVIPMLDEASRIAACIESLDAQTWHPDALDVVVVDGGSVDGSRDIVERLQVGRPWLRVTDNPLRRASAAFNIGVEMAKGDLVCLLSAHGSIGPTFIADSVAVLEETGAAGVGGTLRHEGTDAKGRAIGLAMTSRFGMASPFRYATERRSVDTIGHPMYRAAALAEIGPFDESLERNSDYDLNQRLRSAGYDLVFEPGIVTTYHPRSDLVGLARQFWWYGRWKAHAVRRRPASMRARHAVAPLAVLFALAAPLLCRGRRGRAAVGTFAAAYGVGVARATTTARPKEAGADVATFAAAFPVMHGAWGAGFLYTLVRRWR